jgi:hypothetical protein
MSGDEDANAHVGEDGIRRIRAGGPILLDEAPNGARVTTGGGMIVIGKSAGEVFASTGGGPIDIGPAAGSVVATSGAGDISVIFSGRGAHSADLSTGQGQIELTLPRDISATVVLETAYTENLRHKTRIESDWPLTISEPPEWDATVGTPRRYVRSRLVLGSGEGTIRVRAINGNVTVGSDSWIGPGAIVSQSLQIGANAFVSLGAVVIRNVTAGTRVSGNFAVPHRRLLRMLAGLDSGSDG